MNWKFRFILFINILLWDFAQAEYRAYELEIFDRITSKSKTIITSFSPSDYILTHGGPQRIGVIIRASWICYGDTANGKPVVQYPTHQSTFEPGDRVQIALSKHVTHDWIGVIENIFFRPELRSNIYGIRFPDRHNLYTRYYEANLKKAP